MGNPFLEENKDLLVLDSKKMVSSGCCGESDRDRVSRYPTVQRLCENQTGEKGGFSL